MLKTPLTSLRLELEDLTLRDDVPEDAKAAAARCIRSVDAVNRSAGELVALSRRGSLVEGAELTLHDLATQLAQRWADRLAEERRPLSASAEGDLQHGVHARARSSTSSTWCSPTSCRAARAR